MHGLPSAECVIVVRRSFVQRVEKVRALEECGPKLHEPVTCEICSSKADRWLKAKKCHTNFHVSVAVFWQEGEGHLRVTLLSLRSDTYLSGVFEDEN